MPLDLNLYEHGIKGAKFNKPPSIAYQLVKCAFPEHYYYNVHFGKRELTSVEVETRKNQVKKPLVYVLGFNDPLDNPFQGEFSMSLGRKRIRALIGEFQIKESKIHGSLIISVAIFPQITFSAKREKYSTQSLKRCKCEQESSKNFHLKTDKRFSPSLKNAIPMLMNLVMIPQCFNLIVPRMFGTLTSSNDL